MCTESIVSCGRTPCVARRNASSGSRNGSISAVGSSPRSRISATSSSCLVSAAPAARESDSFCDELGGRGDELAQRLEVAELQIRGLPEERVDVGRELLEVDARRVAEVAARAQRERALALAGALPEPRDHGVTA